MSQGLHTAVNTLAAAVGLKRTSLSPGGALTGPPALSAMWTSTYAVVLLWPLVHPEEGRSLEQQVLEAEDWFDQTLLKAEGSTQRVMDGYLILALSSPPDEPTRTLVQSLELSTRVCRKHVVWPDAASWGGWHGIVAVTVLGLPEVAPEARVSEWPELDPAADALWKRIDTDGYRSTAIGDLE